MDGRTQPELAKPSSWTCRRRRTLRPGRPRSMLQPSSQHRITSKPRRKDRGGHHLQLTHRGLQVRPKQRFQERNGAETPSLPCPGNWTKGFPRCPRRGSSLGHDSASMEVTAPSGVAVVSAGQRRAGISPGPRPEPQNRRSRANRRWGSRSPERTTSTERETTYCHCRCREAPASAVQQLLDGCQTRPAIARDASSRASGAVAETSHLHLAAADHGRCRAGPQPPPPGSTGAQPSSRSRAPKGSRRAARVLATPVQRPDPLDLGPPSRNPRFGEAQLRQPRRAPDRKSVV